MTLTADPKTVGTDRCVVAGVPIVEETTTGLVDRLIALARTPVPDIAVGVNAHVANLCRNDAVLRHQLQSTLNYADGQSVVWASRLLDGNLPERIATTDLAEPLLRAAAAEGLPVFFYGAAPGIADTAAARMRARVEQLDIRAQHGFVQDPRAVLAEVAEHDTAILFVGLGDPLQERWVDAHREHLPALVLTCGGLFDWLSGSNRRAPQWLIRLGLEWLWRLGLEPRRLARRYLLGNPRFVYSVLQQRRERTIKSLT